MEQKYSRTQINNAGRVIINNNTSEAQRQEALAIVDSWRSLHTIPMNTFSINLKRQVKHIPEAIVVQRLKRMSSIIEKKRRVPTMEVSRIQDIGGCRVILPNVTDVFELVEKLRKSRIRHKEIGFKNYIDDPAPSGYRGVHLIYSYSSDKQTTYNKLSTEIQIRTELQHLWATAVETTGLILDVDLKHGEGPTEWLEYFKLVSELFALHENYPAPKGTRTQKTLVKLINKYNETLKVYETYSTIGATTEQYGKILATRTQGYFLIIFDVEHKSYPTVKFFDGIYKGKDDALYEYYSIENQGNPYEDVVLVSAESYGKLIKAYPNYFVDISAFLGQLGTLLIEELL